MPTSLPQPNYDLESYELLKYIYDTFGMEKTARYIYSIVASETDATHIIINQQHLNSQVRILLADISREYEKFNTQFFVKTLAPFDYRINFFSKDLTKLNYWGDVSQKPEYAVMAALDMMPEIRCLCTVPVIIEDNTSFALAIGSDKPNVFSADDLNKFTRIAEALAACMRKDLFPDVSRSDPVEGSDNKSALEQLQMCTGLLGTVKQIEAAAPTDSTVLIIGETGTGKDIAARCLHELSRRKNKPFIRVNCGAIQESLLMSELFGHERGAFTGAINSRAGFFEQAEGGTLFLDEIAELTSAAQVALLRSLATKEIQRVGSSRIQRVDVRVIAATNKDLEKMAEEGKFREDLLYRIKVFPITIPPLRERPIDIPILTRHFLKQKSSALSVPQPEISTESLHMLSLQKWKGNVRELEYTVERAVILFAAEKGNAPLHFEFDQTKEETAASEDWPSLDEAVRRYLVRVLAHTEGKIKGENGAAALLGIPVSTLRSKLQKYGILCPKNRN